MNAARGIFALGIFDDVDLANIFVAVGLVPLLVQADEIHRTCFRLQLLVLLNGNLHLASDFQVGGWPPQFRFRFFSSCLELARFAANKSRNPVHRAQLVQHCAANTRYTIRFEFDPTIQVEGFNRVDQAKDPRRNQVVQIDSIGKLRPDSFRVIANQWQEPFYKFVAQRLVRLIAFEIGPDLGDIFFGNLRDHPTLHGCHFIASQDCSCRDDDVVAVR